MEGYDERIDNDILSDDNNNFSTNNNRRKPGIRLLVVCSANSGKIVPFITEQAEALKANGVVVDFFCITQKGLKGYLGSRMPLLKKIASFAPDIIHAHFGLCGFLANLQRKVPVVTTYHGCDINKMSLRLLSVFPLMLSSFNVFVSEAQSHKVRLIRKNFSILPCGIDANVFYPMDKSALRIKMGWDADKKYILFSSNFTRPEKNAALALEAIKLLPGYELIELKNFSRDQVRMVMNACDAGLLTSIREGSPMFTKELIACRRPVVTTAVGDVKEQLAGIAGCKIVNFEAQQIANALKEVVQYDQLNYDHAIIDRFDNNIVSKRLILIYQGIINNR